MMKISKFKEKIRNIHDQMGNFGLKYASVVLLSGVFKGLKPAMRKMAIDLLDCEFGYIFQNHNTKEYSIPQEYLFPTKIFVYWAQGADKMPYIPTRVVNRLKMLYKEYDIIIIDDNNYKEYIDVEPEIEQLYKNRQISIQTFSDILRFNLLYKYGGTWIDSTLLFVEYLPFHEYAQQCGFYSLNHDSIEKDILWKDVYPVTYTTFFLSTHIHNDIMGACVDFYNTYYKKYNRAIDYFMNDYMMILAMKYHLCDDALAKIKKNEGNPFALMHYFEGENLDLEDCKLSPQKLNLRKTNIDQLRKYLKEQSIEC